MVATVALHGHSHPVLESVWLEADVVSIDANTRGVTSEQATETTAELAGLSRTRSPEAVLFKKVDSTLRGNLAAELAAVLHAYRGTSANKARAMILALALPAQGRTTIGGRQIVHGKLLEETDLWKSETSLPRSNISEVLADGGLSSIIVKIAAVRASINALTGTLTDRACEADILICDAETDDDLRRIAQAAMEGKFPLWAGAAGLAAQFPHAMGLQKREHDGNQPAFAVGPTLIVVGSGATISREQAKVLAAKLEVVNVQVSPGMLPDVQNKSAEIVAALQKGNDTLVILDGDEGSEPQMFAKVLSDLMKPCANVLGSLVATGGETARAILDGLGIDRLQLLGEIEPGLPFSVAEGWTRPLRVLTKAGAFGSPDTLIRCREFLRRLEPTLKLEDKERVHAARKLICQSQLSPSRWGMLLGLGLRSS